MMKRHTVFIAIAALACALLLVGVVAAQSGGPLPAQHVVAQGPALSVVEGTASGGEYRLTGQTWQVRGVADGGGYRLVVSLSPAGTGTPCCCNYLPCVLRN